MRQEWNASAVDLRAEQLEHRGEYGHRAHDGARDDEDRAARDPVEDIGADHVHAGHRGDHRRPGDEDGAARRARCPVERVVRRQTAVTLLARTDHVEEGVVNADRHADQQDDGLHAVVERECLADRAEQAEGGRNGGQRQEHRHECCDDRPEREEQHDQRHRDGQQLRPVQVATHDPVACLTRRDVARLLDGDSGVSRARLEHGCPELGGRDESSDVADDEHGVPVAGHPRDDRAAEPGRHPVCDVHHRGTERRIVRAQLLAVDIAVFAGRRPRLVLVEQRVAARRLADRAVLKRLGADGGPDRESSNDEREPGGNRTPRAPRAPTADRRDRPHRSSVGGETLSWGSGADSESWPPSFPGCKPY